jgi:hypothetical protein
MELKMLIGADANDSFIIEETSTFVFETLPPSFELTVPRTGKPSLIVKFDIGGPIGEYVLTGTPQGADADGVSPTGRTDGVFTVVLPSLPMEDEALVAFEFGDPHGAASALLGGHDGRDFLV